MVTQWDSFLCLSNLLLSLPMSYTVWSPSVPSHNSHFHHSFSVSRFVSSLEKNFQKGHTWLKCTNSETKFFPQLVFINRTDYILLVGFVLVWFGFFPYKSVFLTAHWQCEDPCLPFWTLLTYHVIINTQALHSHFLEEKHCWYSKKVCTLFQLQSYHSFF